MPIWKYKTVYSFFDNIYFYTVYSMWYTHTYYITWMILNILSVYE